MKYSKEIKIAVTAIVGIVLLFFGLNFLKGMSVFSQDNKYFISFSDVSGLASSSPIYANGYRVGVVERVNYDYEHPGSDILVEVGVDPKLTIPKGSYAEITSDMLGNVQVNLCLKSDGTGTIAEGQTIPGSINDGALGKVKDLIPTIEVMLPKLDSILASVNALLADPAIAHSLHHMEQVSAGLTTTTKELNTLMAGLNRQVPGMVAKANGVLDNTSQLTGNLSRLDLDATMTKVNQTLANVEQLTQQLNSDKGTLGLLMRDPQLYDNLNSTVMAADSLLVNFKAHPKRYVHFSVFGKKDK